MMRRFVVVRDADPNGYSGTGKVAEGVEFTDGRVAARWCVAGKPTGTTAWDSVDDLLAIHGHPATRIVWIDEDYDAWRHPIAKHVADLDRRHHPDDYRDPDDSYVRYLADAGPDDRVLSLEEWRAARCRCEGGVHVCE